MCRKLVQAKQKEKEKENDNNYNEYFKGISDGGLGKEESLELYLLRLPLMMIGDYF